MLKIPPHLGLDKWVGEYRYLSPEASAEPGKYRIERAEYQRGIMQAISNPEVLEVVLMASSQVGKTEIVLNVIGYHTHYDPAPILMVQPTLEMAKSFSKDRLSTMIRDSPCLNGLVKDARSRDSGNTMLHKTFPQGHITMCGANSPASLASRPIRIILLDEIDRYPPSAGAEGDPTDLAIKRSTTFWNRKIVKVSTPTIKDFSKIEAAYQETDERHFFVPCKDCGHFQILRWKNVIFDAENTADTRYKCEQCGAKWDDATRWASVRKGEWRATKPFNGKAGFHINEIYSSWSPLKKMVDTFLEAKKLPEKLKTFVNTSLAETWEDDGEGVDDIAFMKRRENYVPDYLPNGIILATAGVDVQDDRVEVETVGWGLDEENWSIEYRIIYGDPSTSRLWSDLDDHLQKRYKRMDGIEIPISITAVDSGGHYTQSVYNFCRGKSKRRIWAIKGHGGEGRPIWPKKASVRNIGRVPLFSVGVDSAKDIIFARLRIKEHGPGHCHFPMYEEWYFDQLTAEKIVISYHKGRPVRQYKTFRRRNEALDCRVYAYCAFVGLQANMDRIISRQQSIIETEKPKPNMNPEPFKPDRPRDIPKDEPEGEKKAKKKLPQRRKDPRQKTNFLNAWK